jgi:hypothetical protein
VPARGLTQGQSAAERRVVGECIQWPLNAHSACSGESLPRT